MDNQDWRKIIKTLGLLTQLGLIIVANIGVGFALGFLADNYFHTELIFKIIGLILGVGAGFYSTYRLIQDFMGDDNNANR